MPITTDFERYSGAPKQVIHGKRQMKPFTMNSYQKWVFKRWG
jgi:hypothetical protein